MRTTEQVIERWKPTPETPVCVCAGNFVCGFCELTDALQREAKSAAEAQAAIAYAVDNCNSHADRFSFLTAVHERDEVRLLKWPAWLTKREQIRSKQ